MLTKLKYLENHTGMGLLNGGGMHIQSVLMKTMRSLITDSIVTMANIAQSGSCLEP